MILGLIDRIKALRVSRNMTQAKLAEKLNISRNSVNSWEQELSQPSLEMLIELSKVFNVSTDYLLGIDETTTVNISGLDDAEVEALLKVVEQFRKNK